MRPRVALAFVVLLLAPTPASAQNVPSEEHVEAIDNAFAPEVIRVPLGTTVTWARDGRSPHTVTADDGSFDSGNLDPGQSFSQTFEAEGAYPYFCTYHGSPGTGMAGVVLAGEAALPGVEGTGPGREEPPAFPAATVRVPKDFATIQEGVDAAEPGGLVLVSAGLYREAVVVTTPFLTIRGLDRNEVILDGGFELANGIQVIEADGVAIENMTARHYLLNGFLWTGVFGYRGSYLTAYDNGDYGLFAYDSRYGQFDRSYASGHPDSGFYIGQCHPCDAVVIDVLAEDNALGFSGTNAGGNLYVVNSEWRDNMSGIVLNTLDSEEDPPQRGATVAGNWIHDNNNLEAPAKALQYPSFGTGIVVTGGLDNIVTRNLIEGHEVFGIVVIPMLDENLWATSGNQVRQNEVRSSGAADLAIGAPSAGGDCFSGNDFGTSAPAAVEWLYGCETTPFPGGGGELGVTLGPLVRFLEATGDFPHGDWRTAPEPPPQTSMAGAGDAPPDPAIPETAVPEFFRVRDARTLELAATTDVNQEVTVLGFSLATSWWGLLVGLYGYVLPLVLYTAWVSVALWDLVRREGLATGARIGWMLGVLLVPLAGPVGYLAFGGSPIQRSVRVTLVAGGLVAYLLFAGIGVLVGTG